MAISSVVSNCWEWGWRCLKAEAACVVTIVPRLMSYQYCDMTCPSVNPILRNTSSLSVRSAARLLTRQSSPNTYCEFSLWHFLLPSPTHATTNLLLSFLRHVLSPTGWFDTCRLGQGWASPLRDWPFAGEGAWVARLLRTTYFGAKKLSANLLAEAMSRASPILFLETFWSPVDHCGYTGSLANLRHPQVLFEHFAFIRKLTIIIFGNLPRLLELMRPLFSSFATAWLGHRRRKQTWPKSTTAAKMAHGNAEL